MARDIGIDLGTANVLIHLKGRGVILNEPAVVAFDKERREIVEVGKAAYEMIGRTGESIDIIRPLKGGVIADFELAEAMLVLFFDRIHSKSFFSKPQVLICSPSEISEVEELSLIEAVERAGAGKIYIEDEAKVAAVGAGVDPRSAKGSMIIDIGGGTTDIAVLSAGDVLASASLKEAGDIFDQAIIQYIKDHKHLLIGQKMAEEVKMSIASATHLEASLVETFDARGRDLVTGLPKSINVTSNDIFKAIERYLLPIARKAKVILEELPPEIAGDIMEQGIILTGGGALIYNMDTFLSDFLQMSVLKADQPMTCIATGAGLMLDMIQEGYLADKQLTWQDKTKRFFFKMKRRIFG